VSSLIENKNNEPVIATFGSEKSGGRWLVAETGQPWASLDCVGVVVVSRPIVGAVPREGGLCKRCPASVAGELF
jgi:hypothetical protein